MKSSYQKLQVWKKAFQLAIDVYRATEKFPRSEIFGLVSQMRRCAVSISSNIAEGRGRSSDKEFRQFLDIAKGSCNELENQILISQELKYFSLEQAENLLNDCTEILKMLSSFIQKIKTNS